MRIAITTCPRKGIDYLPRTLESMFADPRAKDQEICVFSDSVEQPDLGGYQDRVKIACRTASELEAIRAKGFRHNGGSNMNRALKWISEAGVPGCAFEDDIEFSPRWVNLVMECQGALDKAGPYALMLHHMLESLLDLEPIVGVGDERCIYEVGKSIAYGTQGYLFSPSAAREIAARAQLEVFTNATSNYDACTWALDLAIINGCRVDIAKHYLLSPCILKHIGYESTWSQVDGGPIAITRFFKP